MVGNNRMNGELRTMRLPSETYPAGRYFLSNKIPVVIYFPNIITRPVPMILFLKQTVRKANRYFGLKWMYALGYNGLAQY